ncbi:hypothetical protein HYH03_017975 [Edaphochlamys debaryana]|uniref:Bulb-type lectin domain-containing protein n=1 Tax=Edaphochlamys debaryana TaxID=47281 RepID=A0A836BPV6_9CHLO|nr:hypothetical protein HYH03_017975 [Edaphochlamys debaryana]|eukprot:KAG2483129.1 hypothetical protein HYH03_017975 [Edaphochlamys debaryana]
MQPGRAGSDERKYKRAQMILDLDSLSSTCGDVQAFLVSAVEAVARHLPNSNIVVCKLDNKMQSRLQDVHFATCIVGPDSGHFGVYAFQFGEYLYALPADDWLCHGDFFRYEWNGYELVTFPRRRCGDTLHSGEQLGAFDCLTSRSGRHTAIMQGDGNLVLYRHAQPEQWASAPWASGTAGQGDFPHRFKLMEHGGMVVFDAGGRALWRSHAPPTACACRMTVPWLCTTPGTASSGRCSSCRAAAAAQATAVAAVAEAIATAVAAVAAAVGPSSHPLPLPPPGALRRSPRSHRRGLRCEGHRL